MCVVGPIFDLPKFLINVILFSPSCLHVQLLLLIPQSDSGRWYDDVNESAETVKSVKHSNCQFLSDCGVFYGIV